jgi:broad specificity phosphatase PhoE
MKNKIRFLTIATAALLLFSFSEAFAQDKLIILVRHAEKVADIKSGGAAGSMGKPERDPELSQEGRERAARFARAVGKYRPQEIYSTDFKRSRQTAEPIAKMRKKEIQTYDPLKQGDLVNLIMKSPSTRFVVVGHSNTTPALANLIVKKEIFKQLPEPEFGVYWVIRIKQGVLDRVEVYPF